jgi:hypothetical protein
MASLTDQTIGSTYKSLLKLADNNNVNASLKIVTDGEGNNSALSISTGGISVETSGIQIHLDSASPYYGVQIEAGVSGGSGWARSFNFGDVDTNAVIAGYGGYGTDGDTISYLFLGNDYNDSALRVYPSNSSVTAKRNWVGIGDDVTPEEPLHLKSSAATQTNILCENSAANNGYILMRDMYSAGESQYSTGITQSGAATYIANRVHTATDQAYSHADGWKSSTDAAAYRGCALVLDGNSGTGGGSISLYYGHSEGSVAPGSTKALTRGFILRYDGKVGIGVDVPVAKLDVRGRTYFGGPHYMGKTNVTIASGVLDISSTQGPYIAAYAQQGVGSDDADTITSITIDGAEPATGSMIYLTRGANDVITLTLGGSAASTIVGYWADDVGEAVQTGTSAVIGSGYQFVQLMYTEVGRWVIMNPGACQFNV